MSSAGYQYLDDTGVIVPDTSDVNAQVIAEYQTALNDPQLPTNPGTAQGALIVAETNARAAFLANNPAVANQINPNKSGGIFPEALCRLTGLEPPKGKPTTVLNVPVTGVTNTTIPALSLVAKDNSPDTPQFQVISSVTIMGGVATVNLQSVDLGPIPAPSGSWVIPSDVLGWETIVNSGAVTLGSSKLSDAALRSLRANTLALQGISLNEAITSALNDTPGVQSLQFLENFTGSTETISGISLVAHSIWVCVSGGTDADVAAALLNSKSMGCAWNGSTTVNVTDPTTMQVYPVQFQRPTAVPVWIRVTLKANSVTGDPFTIVSQAVLNYQAGNSEVGPGFTVGTDVSPFELAAAIASEQPGIFITKVEVSTDGVTYQTTDLAIAIDHIAITTAGQIAVVTV